MESGLWLGGGNPSKNELKNYLALREDGDGGGGAGGVGVLDNGEGRDLREVLERGLVPRGAPFGRREPAVGAVRAVGGDCVALSDGGMVGEGGGGWDGGGPSVLRTEVNGMFVGSTVV